MSADAPDPHAVADGGAPKPGFWRTRLVVPVKVMLTQGITPEKVSATLATSVVCSLLPFLGLTSMLNLAVGVKLRMNQTIMQATNLLLAPVHLVMIIVYIRLGELIWGAQASVIDVETITTAFRDERIGAFLHRFGWAGVHAITAWALTAPFLFVVIHFSLRPMLVRFARRIRSSRFKAAKASVCL